MNVEERIRSMTESVMRDSSILKANRTEFEKYVHYLSAQSMKPVSICLELYSMRHFLKLLGDVNVKKATKEDMIRVISKINTLKKNPEHISKKKSDGNLLSLNTRETIKASIKRYYKYLLGEDTYNPPIVAWIKRKNVKNKLVKEDLITEEEAIRIIEHCKTVRDKAIVSLLFEGGMRVGELLNIRLKDINLYSQPAHIKLNGKTGIRQIGIVKSKRALIDYLETRRELKPDDVIWRGIIWNSDKPLTGDGIRAALERAAKAASVDKRVNPHSWRHAAATTNAKYMTDMQLKQYFGWSKTSTSPSTYVHMADDDVDNVILKINGMEVPKKDIESAFKVWICTTCSKEGDTYENAVDAKFCNRCKSPRDVRVTMNYEEKFRELEEKQKWMEGLINLAEFEDAKKLADGKTVEELLKEKEAIAYFKEHQEEIMQDYVNTVVYQEHRQAYAELTPEDKKQFEEWSQKIKGIKNDNKNL